MLYLSFLFYHIFQLRFFHFRPNLSIIPVSFYTQKRYYSTYRSCNHGIQVKYRERQFENLKYLPFKKCKIIFHEILICNYRRPFFSVATYRCWIFECDCLETFFVSIDEMQHGLHLFFFLYMEFNLF